MATIAVVSFAFGPLFLSVPIRQRVVADGDELRVRNSLTEHIHHRSTIDAFVDNTRPGILARFGGEIVMLLSDGRRIKLAATRSGHSGRSRREDALLRLQNWLGE